MKKLLLILSLFTFITINAQDTRSRKPNLNLLYTGTVRNVGAGQTYATVTAAITAASAGDIIQIKDGWYDMNSESGNYLLINDTTKQVLIRGNLSNPSAVVLYQSSAVGGFCVRARTTKNLTIQNITMASGIATPTFTVSSSAGKNTVVLDNCIISNTSTSALNTVNITATPTFTQYLELKNCTVTQNNNTSSSTVNHDSPWTDAAQASNPVVVLITGGSYTGSMNWGDVPVDFTMYDATITQSILNSPYVFNIGADVSPAPTTFTSKIDIRRCKIQNAARSGFAGHIVLLGRGTSHIYFAENYIYQDPSVNSLALGIVIKSQAATIGDVIVDGNYVISPRPFLLKGGQNCYVRNNYTLSNWADATNGYGFEINNPNNPDGPISSTGNVVTGNMFDAHIGALNFVTSAGATSMATTNLTCTFNNNNYRINGGSSFANNYIISDGVTTAFINRNSYWTQDVESILSVYQ